MIQKDIPLDANELMKKCEETEVDTSIRSVFQAFLEEMERGNIVFEDEFG